MLHRETFVIPLSLSPPQEPYCAITVACGSADILGRASVPPEYVECRFLPGRGIPKVTGKSRSGQDRGQQGRVAPDLVPPQPDGSIRSAILLKRAHPVQGAHHGGSVAPAQATVVLPELHPGCGAGRSQYPSDHGPVPAGPRHPRASWPCSSARRAAGRGGRGAQRSGSDLAPPA